MSRTAHARRPRVERILLCREIVGKRVELTRDVETRGGARFPKGIRMSVDGTFRGRFRLCVGFLSPLTVAQVDRSSFRILEDQTHGGTACVRCHLDFHTSIAFLPEQLGVTCVVCGRKSS